MTFDCDVIVAGGGLVGSVFALAAAKENLRVLVVDNAPPRSERPFDGRAYALSQSSCRLLAALGMSEMLQPVCQDIHAIRISDGEAGRGAGPFTLGFDSAEIDTGPMGRMAEDRHLRQAVHSALAGCPEWIRTISSRIQYVGLGESAAKAEISGSRAFTAPLIAGCDGRNGMVAQAAGIRHAQKDFRQSAVVCAVEHEKPHNGTAHQFFMPSGPLAILPLTGRRSSLVWTVDTGTADRLAALDDSGFLEELRLPFGAFLGELSLIGGRFNFPLVQSLAERLAAPRAALLGESAHGLHPLAGQGLNLGFRDAASLAEILGAAARRGEDIGSVSVLERYQTWRRLDVAFFAAATDGCNWLFSNDNPALRSLRSLGMAAVNGLPALRRAMIREAAGLHGHLPELMSRQTV